MKGWARSQNVRLVGWHRDGGLSGTKDAADRPGLLAALDAIESERPTASSWPASTDWPAA